MRLPLLLLLIVGCTSHLIATNEPINVYFISGTGADHRLFQKIQLPEGYQVKHVEYLVPDKDQSMESYAKTLIEQIDTSQAFVLVGASLGGMLAIEMNAMISPQQTILIASAKSSLELPKKLLWQQHLPLHKLVWPGLAKQSSFIAQRIVEPDRKNEGETYDAMLRDKDPLFLHRAIDMIVNWDRVEMTYDNVYHIHGEVDHTIPIRNVSADYIIPNGSHMMTLTRGDEISAILDEILTK